jgi:hypothetical protein
MRIAERAAKRLTQRLRKNNELVTIAVAVAEN